jgi:hypothetical protein
MIQVKARGQGNDAEPVFPLPPLFLRAGGPAAGAAFRLASLFG